MEYIMEFLWYYNGEPLEESYRQELIEEGVIGFVYCITEIPTNKKYIGKKLWVSKRKLPPLKGQKRKRTKIVETDWRTYYGSSDLVNQLLKEHGESHFHREILHFCYNKSELSYLEAKEQFDRNVLLSEEYYNGIINCRIGGRGLERLK
jgi:hypothetical protein